MVDKFEKDFQFRNKWFLICIGEDNRGFISLSTNYVVNDKCKHIDVKYQMILDKLKKSVVNMTYLPYIYIMSKSHQAWRKPLAHNWMFPRGVRFRRGEWNTVLRID